MVAAGLEPGDPCPVCQRPLDQHPVVDPTAEEALQEAGAELQVAREAHRTAENALATAHERDRTAKEQLTVAERRLGEALGDADDVAALRQEATSAASRAEEAAKSLAAASATLSEARKAHQTGDGDGCRGQGSRQGVQGQGPPREGGDDQGRAPTGRVQRSC